MFTNIYPSFEFSEHYYILKNNILVLFQHKNLLLIIYSSLCHYNVQLHLPGELNNLASYKIIDLVALWILTPIDKT